MEIKLLISLNIGFLVTNHDCFGTTLQPSLSSNLHLYGFLNNFLILNEVEFFFNDMHD